MNGAALELVRSAILSPYTGDFEWVDDRTALRVSDDPRNRGFTATEIRELTKAWVQAGGAIYWGREERPNWTHRREFVYWVLIEGIDEFPQNLFVEMELTDDSPDNPMVSLVNAHPSSFP